MRPLEALRNNFPFEPTEDQAKLFTKLEEFILAKQEERQVFLLKGYAGTGKTTVVTSLVKILNTFGYKYVLLAPTGRAAKVMASYSGKQAHTIHKKIYRPSANPFSEKFSFTRQPNKSDHTLYIIDESSMISDDSGFGDKGLLEDLLGFVFDKKYNKLLLIGDTAQLPPVGQALSPSLDAEYLRQNFWCHVQEMELRQVMRQAEASGILMNATQLRDQMKQVPLEIKLFTKGWRDIFSMTGEKLEDGLRYAYDKFGVENTIIICRSNKAANLYNQHVRRRLFFAEDELGVGDYLMIVRNNYFWLAKDSDIGFMANGDFVEVTKIIGYQDMYGFRFADVRIRFVDYPEAQEEEVKIMLDTLYTDTPALPTDQNRKLYEGVLEDYMDITNKRDRNKELKKNPYLNALQVKFAYALTCHKAQGGQWKAVFVDQGFLKDDMVNEEFARWLYTALTRSSEELFLLNFNQQLLVT